MMKVRCPICDKKMDGQGPKEWPDWPFCSSRCKLIDLGRWLGEEYRLKTTTEEAGHQDENTRPPKSAAPSAAPNREEA
jgi:endogenous inhibitor of DNA gyrase (YacG/DUF329 family)